MKKIITFLAAIAAIAPTAQAFEYTEENLYTANEEVIVRTTSSQLSVNRGNKQIWFVPEFYAYLPGAYTERVYPYLNEDKTKITFKTEKKEPTLFIFDCLKTTVRHTYSGEGLIGGDMSEVKDNMCSKHFGKDWKWDAERAEEREYLDKEYSLKLRYSYLGDMKVKFDPSEFRYDSEKDIVRVPFYGLDRDGVRWTVTRRLGMKPFYRLETVDGYNGAATGVYQVTCKPGFLGNLSRSVGRFDVLSPVGNKLKLEGLGLSTQNKICKYKDEYKPYGGV